MSKKLKPTNLTSKIFGGHNDDIIAQSNRKLVLGTLIGVAILILFTGFILSFLNFRPNFDFKPFRLSFNTNRNPVSTAVDKVSPSVVAVLTESRTEGWVGQPSTITAGTGVIVSSDGYVITNKHIMEGAKSVSVKLQDGTSYNNVKIVGLDPLNDIAFLKINQAPSLPAAELADSSGVSLGQDVIAVGNSLGQYQNTASSGIISGNNRVINAPVTADAAGDDGWLYGNYYNPQLNDMIQTDASINPGNTGGPLIDLAGQVIGINTTISSEDINELNLAIPINSVKGTLQSLTKTGKFERSFLGVRYVSITPDTAKNYNLSVSSGALLPDSQSIIDNTPAAKAGLQAQDIITKINDQEIGKDGLLFTLIAEHSVGDEIKITFLRDNTEHTVKATLAPYNNQN